MAKIVVFNIPAHWHTNPTLWIITELVKRWHKVIYFSLPEFREKIENTGAEYRNYPIIPNFSEEKKLVQNYGLMCYELMSINEKILPSLIKEIQKIKPDLIINDSLALWGWYIGEILHIPTITSITTALFNKASIVWIKRLRKELKWFSFKDIQYLYKWRKKYKTTIKRYNVQKKNIFDIFFNIGRLNLVYTSKEFQPLSEKFDNKQYTFIWPTLVNRNEKYEDIEYKSLKSPVIYISLWTILNENIVFYQECIDALKDIWWSIVVSVGKDTDIKKIQNISKNIYIKRYVNQLELLKYTDIFITHWGMNSIQEWLFNVVPLIVYPLHLEQEIIAKQVEKTQTGIILGVLDKKHIIQAVKKILKEKKYKQNAKKMARSLQKSWWAVKWTDEIERYLSKR